MEVDDYINLPASEAGQWHNALDIVLRREVKEKTGLEVGGRGFGLYPFARRVNRAQN